MSDDNEVFWVEGDAREVGDLLRLIRTEHLKLTTQQLGMHIDVKPDTIDKCEAGSSIHACNILKKTCENFNLEFNILISKK